MTDVIRIPVTLPSWQELNRRVSAESVDQYGWIQAISDLIGRMSAYGGVYIDSPSALYTGGPTVIANWDDAYPGVGGADALNVTPDVAAGTLTADLDGIYTASFSISGDGTAGALYVVDLYLNAARIIGFSVDQSNQSNLWTLSGSFIVDLVEGDVLDLRLTAAGSTTIESAVFSLAKTGLVQADIDSVQG